ncbi:MAG: hypothetical protein ABIA21_01585, partial [Candidatus Aenigmatarchaeota archaeon]
MIYERAIIGIKEQDTGVDIHYHFRNGHGIPDNHGTLHIPYNDIPNLPSEPELSDPEEMIRKFGPCVVLDEGPIYIEKLGQTLSFRTIRWQETDSATMQEFLGGPY